jgi:RluA family pseudouridine synthase
LAPGVIFFQSDGDYRMANQGSHAGSDSRLKLLIVLPEGTRVPVLYKGRATLAIDKPAGWVLAPSSWSGKVKNLQSAIEACIKARVQWVRSSGIQFLRYLHRLDAETTGVLLMAKNVGAIRAYSDLFAQRRVTKVYLAIVEGQPPGSQWTCHLPLQPDPRENGRMLVALKGGQVAETRFRILANRNERTLLEVRPSTGRTHQIRVHLAESGVPILGDPLYGNEERQRSIRPASLALRAVQLAYEDPFERRLVKITAPWSDFIARLGFPADLTLE